MAWLSGWSYRVKLTIDQNDIDGALAWFPIRVHLGTSVGRNGDDVSFIFDELTEDANRTKIAVTKTDGATELYVEIEKWDDANEVANLWVSRDGWEIASDADTDLYLYFDSSHAANTTYVGDPNSTPAETVWDSNFLFVSHMRDDPDTSSIRDSTDSDFDGAKKDAAEPAVNTSGAIADCQEFEPTNDFVSLGDVMDIAGSLTYSLWFNCVDISNTQGLVSKHVANDQATAFIIHSSTVRAYVTNTNNAWDANRLLGTTPLANATWHRVDAVYTSGGTPTLNVYRNGALDNGALAGTVPASIRGSAASLFIGDNGDQGQYMNGLIDEVRVSNTPRSAAWIKASYESERDDLLAFSAIQTAYEVSCTDGLKLGDTPLTQAIFNALATDGIKLGDIPSYIAKRLRQISAFTGRDISDITLRDLADFTGRNLE